MSADGHDLPERHDPWAALREGQFRLFTAGRFFQGVAGQMLTAVVAWQVFQVSGDALSLALLGGVRFIPSLGLSLFGGALADAVDRRRIVIIAQLAPLACGVVLAVATASGHADLWLIYGMVFLSSVANSFDFPARAALLPSIVSKAAFGNAITVSSTFGQLSFVTGPALAGLLIASGSVSAAYTALAVLVGLNVVTLLLLRPRPPEGRRAVSIEAVREGVRFVWSRQAILGSMTLDMFAVIFGGAQILLPIYASDILHVGATGYGVLAASAEVGSFLMSILLVALPPVRRTGRALLLTVGAFGLFTIVFGLSRWYWLSLLSYGLVGASDQVSVVMRQTTIQFATPDALRGRVSSVNWLFIGASNQLGSVESGLVAALASATFAVVSGGVGCLVVLALVAAGMPELRRYRIGGQQPEGEASLEPQPEALAPPVAAAVMPAATGGDT